MRRSYDRLNFEPGLIYVVYGEWCNEYAYKIGMTKRTPEDRIRAAKSEVWRYSKNLQIIHQISVDNMRVAEMMFHQRFRDRRVFGNHRANNDEHCSEWFDLEDKIAALQTCKSIHIATALIEFARENDTRAWWTALAAPEKRAVAAFLWKSPYLRIEWQ